MIMLKIAQVRLADADARRQLLLGDMAGAAQVFDVAADLTQAFFRRTCSTPCILYKQIKST